MSKRRRTVRGSFSGDLDRLFEQLAEQPLIELGKPVPDQRYMPQRDAARCPASHNRLLIDARGEGAR